MHRQGIRGHHLMPTPDAPLPDAATPPAMPRLPVRRSEHERRSCPMAAGSRTGREARLQPAAGARRGMAHPASGPIAGQPMAGRPMADGPMAGGRMAGRARGAASPGPGCDREPCGSRGGRWLSAARAQTQVCRAPLPGLAALAARRRAVTAQVRPSSCTTSSSGGSSSASASMSCCTPRRMRAT